MNAFASMPECSFTVFVAFVATVEPVVFVRLVVCEGPVDLAVCSATAVCVVPLAVEDLAFCLSFPL